MLRPADPRSRIGGRWAAHTVVVAAAVLASGTLAACTLADGRPFARLDARLTAAWGFDIDRDAGEGFQRLASDFQVAVSEARLTIERVELVGAPSDLGAFDPSRPPAGYSLCHNGHCHADDGRLVPYAEIAAELAGNGALPVVVSLPVGAQNLLGGPTAILSNCEPACDLPLGRLSLARARIARLELAGVVRDGRTPARLPGEVAFTATVDLGESESITAPLDLEVARDLEPAVALALELAAGPEWLDSVDLADVPAVDGVLDLAAHAPSRSALLEAVRETPLIATFSRRSLP